jgi:hypothetical protein
MRPNLTKWFTELANVDPLRARLTRAAIKVADGRQMAGVRDQIYGASERETSTIRARRPVVTLSPIAGRLRR